MKAIDGCREDVKVSGGPLAVPDGVQKERSLPRAQPLPAGVSAAGGEVSLPAYPMSSGHRMPGARAGPGGGPSSGAVVGVPRPAAGRASRATPHGAPCSPQRR